jgi:hypothetical protein
MKRLIIKLLKCSLGFLFVYFLGAFYSVTLNIANWTETTRLMTTLGAGTLFLILAVLLNDDFENK